MSKVIHIFNFHGTDFRVVFIDDEAMFFAEDAMRCLGYKDYAAAFKRYVDFDSQKDFSFDTPSGEQTEIVICDYALRRLVDNSQSPNARAFACWIASYVLPALKSKLDNFKCRDTDDAEDLNVKFDRCKAELRVKGAELNLLKAEIELKEARLKLEALREGG